MNEKVDTPSKQDRTLGDEWENWAGDLDEGRIYHETARLFTIYASIAAMILFVLVGVVLYMIEPRLYQLSPVFVYAARVFAIIIVSAPVFLGIMLIVSVYTGKTLFRDTRSGQIAASRILPIALVIAKRLGISRDRLGNSFVSFSNAIVKANYKPDGGKAIILLPRCLNSDIRKEVKDIGERSGIGVFTATGGGQARKIIREQRPSAVIGVACERDLMSGISDVAPKMPTIGVTNKRPEGPCKNTLVDLDELKNAIKTLTGKSLD